MAGIEDHVTCAICMDLYNDPLALPCLHSFCRHCIQGLVSTSLCLTCPECRAEVDLCDKGIDGLPRNFQLAGIVGSYRRENDDVDRRQSSGQPFCTHHKMTCEITCTTCTKPLCLRCMTSTIHSKKHKLKLVKCDGQSSEHRGEIRCSDHERAFKLHCKDCDTLVCVECVMKQHRGHVLVSIGDVYEDKRVLLQDTLLELDGRVKLLKSTQSTCRMLAQKTQADVQKKRQDLVAYFSRLREALDRKESQMKSELNRREQDIVSKYMTKTGACRRKEKDIGDVTDDLKRLLTESKTVVLKNFKDKTSKTASLLTDEYADEPPHHVTSIDDVGFSTCSLETELTHVYWCWPKEEVRPMRKAPPVPANKKVSWSAKMRRHDQPIEPSIKVGTPVTRGKTWHDGKDDGGHGHVGVVTVVEMDASVSGMAKCTVRWPNGKTGQYVFNPPTTEDIKPV